MLHVNYEYQIQKQILCWWGDNYVRKNRKENKEGFRVVALLFAAICYLMPKLRKENKVCVDWYLLNL